MSDLAIAAADLVLLGANRWARASAVISSWLNLNPPILGWVDAVDARKVPLRVGFSGCSSRPSPRVKGTFRVSASWHNIDGLQVTFYDDNAVANAGLLLPATLADHLGAVA